jgi:putative nucleotidyltransferase with HDIG domain
MRDNSSTVILVVEDSPTQILQLRLLLEDAGYSVITADNGQTGLEKAHSAMPDCIISDVNMPRLDGFSMCEAIKRDPGLKQIPVILLTTLANPADIVRGLESMADCYVTKPYSEDFLLQKLEWVLDSAPRPEGEGGARPPAEFFYQGKRHLIRANRCQMASLLISTYEDSVLRNKELRRAQNALESLAGDLERKVEERTQALQAEILEREGKEIALTESLARLQRAMGQIVRAMVAAMEVRDPYTSGHQRRVAGLAAAIAREMGLPKEDVMGIRMAAMIHDLGKIAIPLDILNKPGKISDIEFALIKTHAKVGYDILKSVEFPWPAAEIVLQHHERLDGSGYPLGLAGDAIRIEAKILSVADVCEAIMSHRPYRPALGVEKSIGEIRDKRWILYDADAVDACVRLVTEKGFQFE